MGSGHSWTWPSPGSIWVLPYPKLKEPVCLELGAPNVIFSGTKHPQEAWLLYKWSTSSSKVMPLIQAGLWMPLGMEYYTEPEKINEWLTEASTRQSIKSGD